MKTKILEQILDWVKDNQLVGISLIAFVIIMGIIIFVSSKENIYKLFLNNKVSIKTIASTRSDLFDKELFTNEPILRSQISSCKFGSEIKDYIFRMVLSERIKSTVQCSKSLISETQDLENMPVIKLKFYLLENTRRIAEGYNNSIRKKLQLKYGENTGDEVYEHVMNYGLSSFNSIYDPLIYHVDYMIEKICDTGTNMEYRNNIHRLATYLDLLYSLLYSGIITASNTFSSFNGSLDRLINGEQRG